MKDIDIILFDLGGVVVELDVLPIMQQWTDHKFSPDTLWSTWLCSPAVRSFESGASSSTTFAKAIISEMNLSIDTEGFLQSFLHWPKALYPGAEKLISQLNKNYTTACLSNSNELHWPRLMGEMGLGELFSHHFSSHLIGKIKPDKDCFQHALDTLDCQAAKILFLDDNEVNVNSARDMGLHAYTVKGPEDIEHLFVEIGLTHKL